MKVRSLSPVSALLVVTVAIPGAAQVLPQPRGGPRLPPPPAPVLSSINQTPGAISPQIWFQVAQGVMSISVSRAPQGGAASVITPQPVPLSQVPTPTGQYYYFTDNTLNTMGVFNYQVTAIYGDGRSATSTALPFSPVTSEPSSLSAKKPNPFTAVILFQPSKFEAQTYRLFGAGLPPTGVYAVKGDVASSTGQPQWSVIVPNLAAGTYNWVLRAHYAPGFLTPGVGVSVTLP